MNAYEMIYLQAPERLHSVTLR